MGKKISSFYTREVSVFSTVSPEALSIPSSSNFWKIPRWRRSSPVEKRKMLKQMLKLKVVSITFKRSPWPHTAPQGWLKIRTTGVGSQASILFKAWFQWTAKVEKHDMTNQGKNKYWQPRARRHNSWLRCWERLCSTLSTLHLSLEGTRLLGLEQENPHTCLLFFTQFCFPMFPCAP